MNAIESVRLRLTSLLWNEGKAPHPKEAQAYLDALRPGDAPGTLCWADIDYSDQNRAFWKTHQHNERIILILRAFGAERLTADPAYAEMILRAFRFWLHHDFQNPNWWYNDIGMPISVTTIALLLHPVLDKPTLARAAEISGRSYATMEPGSKASKWTGANLIWGMNIAIRCAILTENEDLLKRAAARAADEICNDRREGIQADGSFFQHGPRLYSGGYGRSYAADIALMAYILQGTPYQFSAEKLNIFLSHILDGLYHMTQNDALDWACIGRELSRLDAVKASSLRSTLRRMLDTEGTPRRDELLAYLDSLTGGPRADSTKYFPCAAMLCHHFGGIYVGGKFHNNRLWGSEVCNEEGVLGFNMSYGTHTCIMRTGAEYHNINPVWDYARIPGTTARTETDEELYARRDWYRIPLPNGHSGGRQSGAYAAVYEFAEHDGVEAMVADFAIPGAYIRLGCGIRTVSGKTEALVTTVDQCLTAGDSVIGDTCVEHNGIRYSTLDGAHLDTDRSLKTGSWYRNSRTTNLGDAPVSAEVLTITLTHPAGGEGSYAYMITPADAPVQHVEIVSNTCEEQSIRLADGRILAVRHPYGKVILPE